MSSEMSNEQMQNKIAAARRDAEGLKDKIKRKKDELADASCKTLIPSLLHLPMPHSIPVSQMNLI